MRRQSWWHVVSANSKADGTARTVLLILAMHATRNGYVGLPLSMLARLSRCKIWKVRQVINQLLASRDLKFAWSGSGRKADVYQIIVPALKEVDTKKYRVTIVEVPPIEEFPPLRVMEEPKVL